MKTSPRTQPAPVRREALMNAAQELFLKQGVGPTTVEQITAAAGVAKGTFYLHFESKEAVLTALRIRYVEAFQAQLLAAAEKHPRGEWDARLGAWAAAAVGTYLDSAPVHDLVFHEFETDGSHPDIVVEYLSTLLEQGAAEGVWSVQDSRLTAVYLFNGVHGVVADILQNHRPVKRPQLIRKVQQLCFRLVGAHEQR